MNTSCPYRTGFGYDIHRLVEGRKLILGGIEIPYHKGLLGHSDADCLSHAIADALLGAAGLEDIGHFFPNTDPNNKDLNSQEILKKANQEITKLNYTIINIDCTLIAEAPKLTNYKDLMKKTIAQSLTITPSQISIKATTNEQIDSLGANKGIAAYATCLIAKT